ncbi:hypothetical protein LIER_37308 [Lithospermum erythrorhizon]|uniref:Uncharacterized protein n=1 Tax=Lithospermum erythrorhizon TaxID=34254 RepID=A0AAV3PLJ0_LITER
MKVPYSLSNGLSIEEGHLWNKRVEALYMIKALNASYACTRQIEEFKTSEEGDLFVGKEAAATVYGFMTQFLGDLPQLAALAEDVEVPIEGGEVVEWDIVDEEGGEVA